MLSTIPEIHLIGDSSPVLDSVIKDSMGRKIEFLKRAKKQASSAIKHTLPKTLAQYLPTSLESKKDKLWLYQILRDSAIGDHQETLLLPIADQVQLVRDTGVNVFAVAELPTILIPVVDSTSGSFFVRTDNLFDVWLDYSEISKLSNKFSVPVGDCLELALFHETGHFLANSEEDAWLNAFVLWRKHGKSSDHSFKTIFQCSRESYIN